MEFNTSEEINEDNTVNSEEETNEDNTVNSGLEPKALCIISAILMYGFNFIFDIVASICVKSAFYYSFLIRVLAVPLFFMELVDGDCPGLLALAGFATTVLSIIGLILLIYVRIKFPDYTVGKIMMWIAVVYIVVLWIIVRLILKSLESCCEGCY